MTISGIVHTIVYRNAENGYTVLRITPEDARQPFTAVGRMPLLDVGDTVTLEGDFTYNPRFGEQFSAVSYTRVAPSTETAIISYLSSGAVRGIGQSLARTIVSRFGIDTLSVMENDPEALLTIPGIGKKKAAMILESFHANNLLRNVLLALEPYGITVNQASKMIEQYGDLCLAKIQENPYQLITDIDGIGFITADRIAQNVSGFETDSLQRIRYGVLYILMRSKDEMGNTYLPRDMLLNETQRLLGCDPVLLDDTLEWMLKENDICLRYVGETEGIFLPFLEQMERYTAKRLLELRKGKDILFFDLRAIETDMRIILSEQQRKAVYQALSSGLLIITGGPGTGKTTVIQAIAHGALMSGLRVALAAPTGRASKRMSEATGFDASTIHRLLEYSPEGGFNRNETNPLPYEMIIIDEMSMVDIPLMYALLKAVPPLSRLILIGDSDQLPPVGCGNVLLDAVRSGSIPCCTLTEVFRQAQQSCIVTNAHLINNGDMPVLDAPCSDFIFEQIYHEDRIIDRLTELVTEMNSLLPETGSIFEAQVLSPMKNGKLGVIELNRHLQKILNPPAAGKAERTYGGIVYREGDKVMQIKNDYQLEWKKIDEDGSYKEGFGVFNGDLGILKSLDHEAETGTVHFDDGRVCRYQYKAFEELALAYCITIHKSQGSEFNTVLLPISNGPPMLMTRNLLYTAVTRAKKRVFCIGRKDMIKRMVQNIQKNIRFTALPALLAELDAK